ncbi:uncharacterized protein LOC101859664 [Aplysia californica]|uniref:Uncharacterized protein LOC101859664 n=1 Tax=Aplysia californica TaxID=6500 RepID=A0ABM0K2E9_APLCA|nr:uncharacterized protein LOC101859664 [Aplysia californica]
MTAVPFAVVPEAWCSQRPPLPRGSDEFEVVIGELKSNLSPRSPPESPDSKQEVTLQRAERMRRTNSTSSLKSQQWNLSRADSGMGYIVKWAVQKRLRSFIEQTRQDKLYQRYLKDMKES